MIETHEMTEEEFNRTVLRKSSRTQAHVSEARHGAPVFMQDQTSATRQNAIIVTNVTSMQERELAAAS